MIPEPIAGLQAVGCPQDVKSQDRDETETFEKTSGDRLETETLKTETTSLQLQGGTEKERERSDTPALTPNYWRKKTPTVLVSCPPLSFTMIYYSEPEIISEVVNYFTGIAV